MSVSADLAVNLAATAIGVSIGWSWQRARSMYRQRNARRYWKPFIGGSTRIILGTFSQFQSFEPTGFVGFGDAIAMSELSLYLERLGASHATIEYAHRIDPTDLSRHHLIVLGGPDANSVAHAIVQRSPGLVRFGDPAKNEITFRVPDGTMYVPHMSDGEVRTDYALVRRLTSPFNPERQVIFVAGSFGFGTWGGVRYLIEESAYFKQEAAANEWLIEIDVYRATPQRMRKIFPSERRAA